jgi:hypothetical protein
VLTRLLSPRTAAVFALLATAAAALATEPVWVTAGLDVWNAPALRQELADGAKRHRELGETGAVVMRRIEAKEALVGRLIDGEISLAEAAARFLDLNRIREDHMSLLRAMYPDMTDDERTARNVIAYTATRLADLPADRQAEVTERLEAEFACLDFARVE